MLRNTTRIAVFAAAFAGGLALATAYAEATPSLSNAGPLGTVVLGLFLLLTTWLALWSCVGLVGFLLLLTTPQTSSQITPHNRRRANEPSRTAILLPIYNEDIDLVFAGLKAMRASLAEEGAAAEFDYFILSDSTDPDVWLAEEVAWRRLVERPDGLSNVYYRHRNENSGRKAGNIADFCRRWGDRYEYLLMLDADSLMEGATVTELVRRMDQDPQLGILQTSPLPLGQDSILSRGQHFICRLCGPLLTRGLAYLCGDGGNYWGHNAIIRSRAFIDHCGMAPLPGARPLGGEIMSHDFVEAALMRRAGYRVQLAWDLDGSYEQSPATMPEYLQRDQRWCQGNLQHTRILLGRGVKPMSRFHFFTGILAYSSSLVWAAFLVLSALLVAVRPDASLPSASGLTLLGVVGLLLVLPRLLSVALVATDPTQAEGFGGMLRVMASALFEFLTSVIAAPILMVFHSLFVANTLTGTRVEWNAQDRTTRGVSWADAWSLTWWVTALGVAVVLVAAVVSPWLLAWLTPIVFGLCLSTPFVVGVSSSRLGRWVAAAGLLQTPEESQPPPVVRLFNEELEKKLASGESSVHTFLTFLRDAARVNDHINILDATKSRRRADVSAIRAATDWAKSPDTVVLGREELKQILCDPASLRRLHRTALSSSA